MGSCSNAFRSSAATNRDSNGSASFSFPNDCLMEISQTLASLRNLVLDDDSIASRAVALRRESPSRNQSNAWVSTRTFTRNYW